jgi:hypothetical protein
MTRTVRTLTVLTVTAALLLAPLAAAGSLEGDLELMMSWFAGEFDNNQQVQEQKEMEEPPEQPHEWIHSIFVPVELPAFGDHVFYVEQYSDGDPTKIYRNRLYSFAINEAEQAIQLTIYSFPDPQAVVGARQEPDKLDGMSPDSLRTVPGCEVYWTRDGDRFLGEMKEGACRIDSQRLGKTIIIDDDLVLTRDEIWISDRATDSDGNWVFGNKAGVHHKLKRSRDFRCWAVVENRGGDEAYTVERGLDLHDQGGTATITSTGEEPITYSVQLEQRVYTGERSLAVLKLAVYEEGNEESLAYAWAEPSAKNIGMNLRLFQAGCTAAE